MPFNFNNIFQILTQFNQFKRMIDNSNQNPASLLEQELKRRNMSNQEVKNLIEQAKSISNLFGIK